MDTLLLLQLLATGFATSLGLIVAIGAQNTFVLRQSLRGEHVALVVAVSALSDVALISLGVAGLDRLVQRLPLALPLLTLGGALFLLWHGWQALQRSRQAGRVASNGRGTPQSAWTAIGQAAAFSWLNPHAWLDTTVLIGSLAQAQQQQHGQPAQWWFAAGAAAGSVAWFIGLAWAAARLAPWFERPAAWRWFDRGVAVLMTVLALSLLQLLVRR